jgi:hypothetical protein
MIVIKIAVSFMTKLDKTLVLDEPIALAKKNAVDQSALMSNRPWKKPCCCFGSMVMKPPQSVILLKRWN